MDVVNTSSSTPHRVDSASNQAAANANNGLTSHGRMIRTVAILAITATALTGVAGIIAASVLPSGSNGALAAGIVGGVSAGVAVLGAGLAMKYA